MKSDSSVSTLAFLIMPGFPMACLTSAIEPLRAANEISGKKVFRWLVVGERADPVLSSAEVRFEPDVTIDDLAACDTLYILSSPSGDFQNEKKTNSKLRLLERQGVGLGAFSAGIFPLARTGLLNNRRCSVHWVYEAAFKNRFPDIRASNLVIEVDGRFETAAGAAAVFDLMLRRVEFALGVETMTEVACWFQHPTLRGDAAAQRVPARLADSTTDMLPDRVSAAIKLLSNHITEPVQISRIARQIGISTRQLDRLFQQSTGRSPLKYYRQMRMDQARQLVLYSNEKVGSIALAVGYSARAPFASHYKQAFGCSPSQHREQANRFRFEKNAPLPSVAG